MSLRPADTDAESSAVHAWGGRWWRFVSRRYRRACNGLREICQGTLPDDGAAQVAIIQAILESHRLRATVDESRESALASTSRRGTRRRLGLSASTGGRNPGSRRPDSARWSRLPGPGRTPAYTSLRWHYRSRHESLIAVSNHEFHDNRLVLFPSPDAKREETGLHFRHEAGTCYERGVRKRFNAGEARAVADAVMEHAQRRPDSDAWRRRLQPFAGAPDRGRGRVPAPSRPVH